MNNYRPITFEQVIGQEVPVLLIQNAFKAQKLPNVLAIYGESGIGKTTLARLIASLFVCENVQNANVCGQCFMCKSVQTCTMPDVLEFDAASYTSVDDIRIILDQCNYLPQFGKKKIFIIDEAHMLSRNAAAALLKTFEDTFEHTMFILATTDIEKLSNAIKSRCFCLPLKTIEKKDCSNHLLNLAQAEKINLHLEAAEIISHLSNGSMREAISIFNRVKLISSEITKKEVHKILFFAKEEDIEKLCNHILAKQPLNVYELCYEILENSNISVYSLLQQIMIHFQNAYNFAQTSQSKKEILTILVDLNKLNGQINKQHIFIEKIVLGLVGISIV